MTYVLPLAFWQFCFETISALQMRKVKFVEVYENRETGWIRILDIDHKACVLSTLSLINCHRSRNRDSQVQAVLYIKEVLPKY